MFIKKQMTHEQIWPMGKKYVFGEKTDIFHNNKGKKPNALRMVGKSIRK